MAIQLQSLEDLRLPQHPDEQLFLDGSPLHILDEKAYDQLAKESDITAACGAATVLFHWCPEALFALLDIHAWFSFTWTLNLPDETKLEIGRIRNQVTMGRLDKDGLWKVMITYTMSQLDDGRFQGPWIPNTEETMLGDRNIEDPTEIDHLGRSFVKDLIAERRWLTGKNLRHHFFIESLSLGMDPWDDGLAMNPHWLYTALDLAACTICRAMGSGNNGKSMNRCGRCGTAAYCSLACQQRDWPVHKAVCALSAEDRGKALGYSRNGGLINWMGGGEGDGSDREEESETG